MGEKIMDFGGYQGIKCLNMVFARFDDYVGCVGE